MRLRFLGPKQLERMGFRGLEQPEERTTFFSGRPGGAGTGELREGGMWREKRSMEKPGEHLGEGEKTGVVGARDPEGSWTRIWKHSERYIVVSGCFQLLLTETPAKSGLNSAGLDWLMFGKSWHPKAASGKARSRVQRPQQQPYISTFPFFS